MNPNYAKDPEPGYHENGIWKKYVENSGFGKIFIIAHSYGGYRLRNL